MFELTKEQHFNLSLLDTHDKNTDYYKRMITNKQLTIDASFTLIGSMINLNVGSFKSYTKIINSIDISHNPNRIILHYNFELNTN